VAGAKNLAGRTRMDYQACSSLPAMFFAQAAGHGDGPLFWAKRAGTFQPISWRSAAEQVRSLASGLRAFGLAPGDRVLLVAENRPEWMIADLAIMSAGCITVPAYTTNTREDHRHLLANCGARAVIVSTSELAQRVVPAADETSRVALVVAMEPVTIGQLSSTDIYLWDDVLARGCAAADRSAVAGWVGALQRDDIACLIYTSGTGGLPRGVMLTHANILANCYGACRLLETIGLGNDVFLNFLPLSHAYEHTAGMMFPLSLGAQIYFAEGAETLAADLPVARPTIMTAVPRLYETLHRRILAGIERDGGLKAKLFHRAVALGTKRYGDPGSLTLWERLVDFVLDRLVRSKIRGRFGGRLKAMVSGGAPLNPDIGRFFLALGVPLLQGYGQTEASPVIAVNPPRRIKIESVGPPLAGVEVRIAEDGEILVRGDLVMKGYWNDPEATARALVDGWLHTGDVGALDPDGYIVITDRKRDFIKTSGGDTVSPARIEGSLASQPEIGQAVIFGDRRPYLVAVIVPHTDLLRAAEGHHGDAEVVDLANDPDLQKAVAVAVARSNADLSPSERVRRFIVSAQAFTTENGQMTPTLKLKRHVIRQVYGEALLALYEPKSV
jgi:long-chain acyl-CoA synthetase